MPSAGWIRSAAFPLAVGEAMASHLVEERWARIVRVAGVLAEAGTPDSIGCVS
jgi:hypothetical protein